MTTPATGGDRGALTAAAPATGEEGAARWVEKGRGGEAERGGAMGEEGDDARAK
jgi:hypothetical protein